MGDRERSIVTSALGVCAVVALFALAADQHRGLVTGDELTNVSAYKSMLQKNLAETDKQIPLARQMKEGKHSVKASRCVLRRLMCAPPARWARVARSSGC